MQITEETTELQELQFQLYYGCLFSASLFLEYNTTLQSILTDKRDTYFKNKVKEAQTGCNRLYSIVSEKVFNGMNEEQVNICKHALQVQRELAYSIFGLSGEQQEKVKELIKDLQC